MPNPSVAAKSVRAIKLRDEVKTLEKAAAIATDMGCHAVANSVSRLADVRRGEARLLTQVSEMTREKT
jgi:hypothetical protein